MRQLTKYALVFVLGCGVGGSAAWLYLGKHVRSMVVGWYTFGIADQANIAAEIYDGRAGALADRIRDALPSYVEGARQLGESDGLDWALWRVGDVYSLSETEPPVELRELLAALPPRPSCKRPDPLPMGSRW